METTALNVLIENNLNPYLVVMVTTELTSEEICNDIVRNLSKDIITEIRTEYNNNCIEFEVSTTVTYLLIKKNYYPIFIKHFNENNVKFKITDAMYEIWNMSADEFNTLLSSNTSEVTDTLNMVFGNKFNRDDVLDKILSKGVNSLNRINKFFLK